MAREHRQLERLLRSKSPQAPDDLVDGIVREVSAPSRSGRVPVGRRQLTVAIALVLSLVVVSTSLGGFASISRTVSHAGAAIAHAVTTPPKKDKKTRKRKKAGRTRLNVTASAITYVPNNWICHWKPTPITAEYNNTSRGVAGNWYSDKADTNPSSIFDYDFGSAGPTAPTGAQCAATSNSVSFSVANPGTRTAGTAFSVTITAKVNGVTNNTYTGLHTIGWTGASNSPNGTAPLFPSTSTALTFSVGSATATGITLYNAVSTTLTATESSPSTASGNTGAFAVNAGAGNALSFSVGCAGFDKKKNKSTAVTVLRGDAYGNIDPSFSGAISINLTATGGGSWSVSPVTMAVNATTSGSSTYTNPNSQPTAVSMTAHTATAGYTDATCSFTTIP